MGRLRRGAGRGRLDAGGDDARFRAAGLRGVDGRFRTADADFSTQEVVEVADATSSADLYHWCAMVWGEHWEQRLGVKLAQGEASLVLGAVASARANAEGFSGRKASPEWSPTDCQPCASL